MSNYLLLRDNKQSGPYSIEELRSKGLKPYDLVWVDGKSAAWRYPSEVQELKSFAPVVEEQPFDRFFKKPNTVTENVLAEAPIAVAPTPTTPVIAEPAAGGSGAPSAGRRIIYVTMPGAINSNINKTAAFPTAPPVREADLSEAMRPQATPAPDYSREQKVAAFGGTQAAFAGSQIPRQGLTEEDFSHESSFGGTHFVEKQPHYTRSFSSRKMRPLAIAVSVIALLAAGVLIGLSINGHFRASDRSSVGREEVSGSRDHSNSPMPVYTTAASNPDRKTGGRESLSDAVISDPALPSKMKTTGEGIQKRKTTSSKEKAVTASTQKSTVDASSYAKDSALAALAQSGREASHRSEETADKESVKNAVVSQVAITTNKYNTGTFGGISELQLTVSNRSIYPLDLVVVELQYIQANKKVYKTENLYFRGIGAGAALMQEAPKSSRGIKVQSRIILINSKELGLSYSGI